ncbi:hypothetical protein PVL29_017780 [Vitis rotundifolia]|uniref:Uncharacterized protein n=1 Tax=Vitis rotundifolia TaxID=103349 RepID=A0AA38ZCF3_VITRO|nr:hypothetical protein PVL29_017780 [Vitis rotundifolia]
MHLGFVFLFGCFCDGNSYVQRRSFSRCSCGMVEDLISGFLFPLFLASNGLKTDVFTIRGFQSRSLFVLVIFTACLGKIAGTMAVSLCCRMPGLVELIVLNIDKREENSVKDSKQAVAPDQHGQFGSCGDAAAHFLEIQEVQKGPAKAATHALDDENFQSTTQHAAHCFIPTCMEVLHMAPIISLFFSIFHTPPLIPPLPHPAPCMSPFFTTH